MVKVEAASATDGQQAQIHRNIQKLNKIIKITSISQSTSQWLQTQPLTQKITKTLLKMARAQTKLD